MKLPSPNPENVVAFDCDGTLILLHKNPNLTIIDPYDGMEHHVRIHARHLKLLKDRRARGCWTVVWSANGKAWAQAVVNALKVQEFVCDVQAKPQAIVDDLTAEEVFPNRIFIKDYDEV